MMCQSRHRPNNPKPFLRARNFKNSGVLHPGTTPRNTMRAVVEGFAFRPPGWSLRGAEISTNGSFCFSLPPEKRPPQSGWNPRPWSQQRIVWRTAVGAKHRDVIERKRTLVCLHRSFNGKCTFPCTANLPDTKCNFSSAAERCDFVNVVFMWF